MPHYGFVLAATAAILLAELALGRHKGVYGRGDYLVIGLCAVLNPLVSRALAGLVFALVFQTLLPGGRNALARLPLLPSFLVLYLIIEMGFYWGHRLAHEGQVKPRWRWLWKIHRTHHAGRYMNVLVTQRVALAWSFVVPTAWLMGLAVYLGQGEAAGWVVLCTFVWNLVTHSHFRWDDALRRHRRFGPAFRGLEHIIISPGVHHTHHGYGKDGAMYRNYAVTFAFIDWMFGTLHIPAGRPSRYGVPGPQPHWAEEVFYPLVHRDPDPAGRPQPAPAA